MKHSIFKIGILFHKNDRYFNMSRYIVHQLAYFWRDDGHDVTYIFGTRKYVPADILLVHVNLSVVPDSYLEFAAKYKIVLNGDVKDIRKSTVSSNIVKPGDDWEGPVIVKSNLNCAGGPELMLRRTLIEHYSWRLQQLRRKLDLFGGDAFLFVDAGNYPVYESLRDVPKRFLRNKHLVVERFTPEIKGGHYCTRIFQFLGNWSSCYLTTSGNPVVKAGQSKYTTVVKPHDEIIPIREKFKLDYGKLDYLVHNNEVILLDVNKTTGATLDLSDPAVFAARRNQANGLYSYIR